MNSPSKLNRREFIKTTSLLTAGLGLGTTHPLTAQPSRKNKLPRWKGFNLLDFFSPDPAHTRPATPEDYFRWMSDWGFDFVRLPMAYPAYLKFDRSKPITPEEVYQIDEQAVDQIDRLVALAHQYKMHVSLNLHRAPGYCINAGFHEPYNLWNDQPALDAFCFHWQMWAKRYQHVSTKKISFDLLNKPKILSYATLTFAKYSFN